MEEMINGAVKYLFLDKSVVTIPIFSTLLVILFKLNSMNEYNKSILNIGLELATAGIFVLLTNINFAIQNKQSDEAISSLILQYGIKIIIYLVIVFVFSLGIRTFAWNKETASTKNTGITIIIIDVIGIFLLAVSIVFAGGNK